MYKEHFRYDSNIFVEFIDKFNKENYNVIVHLKNSDLFCIFPSQRVTMVNDRFLKVIDEDGVEIKLCKIRDIVSVERV